MNESYTTRKSPRASDVQSRIRRIISRQRTTEHPAVTHHDHDQNPLQTSGAAVQSLLVASWGWGYIS